MSQAKLHGFQLPWGCGRVSSHSAGCIRFSELTSLTACLEYGWLGELLLQELADFKRLFQLLAIKLQDRYLHSFANV